VRTSLQCRRTGRGRQEQDKREEAVRVEKPGDCLVESLLSGGVSAQGVWHCRWT